MINLIDKLFVEYSFSEGLVRSLEPEYSKVLYDDLIANVINN